MPYKITAKKDDSSLDCERQSLLVIAAKARVWAEEGWEVLVKDDGGNSFDVDADWTNCSGSQSRHIRSINLPRARVCSRISIREYSQLNQWRG